MDCPKYANAMVVTHNDILEETVIRFIQNFPAVDGFDETTGDAIISSGRETVCSVVMSDETAKQLFEILRQSLRGDACDE